MSKRFFRWYMSTSFAAAVLGTSVALVAVIVALALGINPMRNPTLVTSDVSDLSDTSDRRKPMLQDDIILRVILRRTQ